MFELAQALTVVKPVRSNVRKVWCCGLVLIFGSLLAHAQFDKTPWPRSQALPQIDVVDLQGQHWTDAKLKGQVVVLNFWATWCGPCKEEMPSLQTLHSADGTPPVVIGINVKETASTVKRFAAAQGLTFPLVLDPQGEITRRWGVRVYPTTVLIDTHGQARWRVVGEVDWSGAEAASWLSALQKPAKPTGR
jgi:thiol-disulfide isomerase/thioredoxin